MKNKQIDRSHRRIMLMCLAVILSCMSFSPARSQIRVGFKGGFQLAEMNFNSDALKKSNRAGFFLGPTAKFTLPIVGLGIDASILYDQRDLKVDERTFKQKSLLLQGNARYGVGIGDILGVFIHAGPQFSFNVGNDIIHWFTDGGDLKQFSLQETMLSFNMGLGVDFANHFEATISYNIPVGKTADFTWHELSQQLQEQSWNHAKSRTNAWSVAVKYYF